MSDKNYNKAMQLIEGVINSMESGSSIPLQLSELKRIQKLLQTPEPAVYGQAVFDKAINTPLNPLLPVPMTLFPTMASLQSVVDMAESQVPINNKNVITGLLMTYHNTLLKQLNVT